MGGFHFIESKTNMPLSNLPSERGHARYLRGLLEDIFIVLLLINGNHAADSLGQIYSCTLDLVLASRKSEAVQSEW